jgi:hypothetical protein
MPRVRCARGFCTHDFLGLIEREYSNGSHLGVGDRINVYYAPRPVISCQPSGKRLRIISQNLAAGHKSGLRVTRQLEPEAHDPAATGKSP